MEPIKGLTYQDVLLKVYNELKSYTELERHDEQKARLLVHYLFGYVSAHLEKGE